MVVSISSAVLVRFFRNLLIKHNKFIHLHDKFTLYGSSRSTGANRQATWHSSTSMRAPAIPFDRSYFLLPEKHLHNVSMSLFGRHEQRGEALIRRSVHLYAVLPQQQLDHLVVPRAAQMRGVLPSVIG